MENPNHRLILRVLGALGSLADRVVIVGGAVVELYCDRPRGLWEVRPTKDVDIVTHVVTYGELRDFEFELYRNGFYQTPEDDVMCRFRWEDVIVDVMSVRPVGWAPSNRWIEEGFPTAETVVVEGKPVRILTYAYFLATKFAAFRGRGAKDARLSHDLEDIVTILDGQSQWVALALATDKDVKAYLKEQFQLILQDARLQEAILGNLPYSDQGIRYQRIIDGMQAFCQSMGCAS